MTDTGDFGRGSEAGRRCPGCGVLLQSERPSDAGYVPPEALERPDVVCRRCFRLRHYGDPAVLPVEVADVFDALNRIASTRCLVVHIVDLFDFEGSIVTGLHRFVGSNPIVLAVNKTDVLPAAVSRAKIERWVRARARELGLQPIGIVLMSARSGEGFDRLYEAMRLFRNGSETVVVGATNVGKSTLVNRLIRDLADRNANVTVSPFPGTTLDVIRIPLKDGSVVVDTPGIAYPWRLTEMVGPETVKELIPDGEIRPRVYQLNEGQTLFFGGLVRFDYLEGGRRSFTCFVPNDLRMHRTKIARADELWLRRRGDLLVPPYKEEEIARLPSTTVHAFTTPPGKRWDVSVSGLGWIQINGDAGARVELRAPKGVRVALRPAMLSGR